MKKLIGTTFIGIFVFSISMFNFSIRKVGDSSSTLTLKNIEASKASTFEAWCDYTNFTPCGVTQRGVGRWSK